MARLEGGAVKAWLVTSGCYSDYSVDNVFSTEAKADAYVAAWREDNPGKPSDYDPRVEESELDPEYRPRGHDGWDVFITRGGDIESIAKIDDMLRSSVDATETGWWVKCFARDEDHATKIAGEKRQELLARAALCAGGRDAP